ncbi:centrosomal protein of 41 kDa isoform X2 [Nelusetta ayraudi]|uniref:centrosomal protein of 41 kDa isoform X2 n=1 Tax=Nelusetta ayraudi TaxID=303726 RepID=UPI003F71CD71
MSFSSGIGSAEYMERRIPKNAKYQHVKTKLDTGCSLTKHMERMEEMKRNYKFRNDEIFKRLKVTTFAQLVLQVSSISCLNDGDDGDPSAPEELECFSERSDGSRSADLCSGECPREPSLTARSKLLRLINGVGELNLNSDDQRLREEEVVSSGAADTFYPDCPYLLLDVREREQYEQCHIISAHSFPIALLSRTMNPYAKEVLEYKNAAGKIIIVYDEDERIASQAATTMCQRGFENLFMLSGGLKVTVQKFPEGLTTGSAPASCLRSPKSPKGRGRSSAQQQQQQQQQPPAAAERRFRFTADELAKIQEQLDEILVHSNGSSRMSSRMSAGSSLSSAPSAHSSSARGGSRARSVRPWK